MGPRVEAMDDCAGRTGLHATTVIDDDTVVKLLLNCGANINVRDGSGLASID